MLRIRGSGTGTSASERILRAKEKWLEGGKKGRKTSEDLNKVSGSIDGGNWMHLKDAENEGHPFLAV